jgi:methionyl-tRNA formyltransferase
MQIVFFGTPDFVIPVLEMLLKKFEVVGVVTAPDAIIGRKKLLTPSPVKTFASEHDIKTIHIPQVLNTDFEKQLQSKQADLYVVAAYGKIIPKHILEIPRYGAINIHPSLLPKYRGPSPIQSAILNGDKSTGVTIIKMDEKMDHGPILAQKEMSLGETDTFDLLLLRMFIEAAKLLPDTIERYISGSLKSSEQNEDEATYCSILTKEDGFIDMENPPDYKTLDRMIRAYYPWPTVWTRVRIRNQEARIMKFLPEGKVQIEGGKPMSIKEFLNGYPELKETLAKFLIPNS